MGMAWVKALNRKHEIRNEGLVAAVYDRRCQRTHVELENPSNGQSLRAFDSKPPHGF